MLISSCISLSQSPSFSTFLTRQQHRQLKCSNYMLQLQLHLTQYSFNCYLISLEPSIYLFPKTHCSSTFLSFTLDAMTHSSSPHVQLTVTQLHSSSEASHHAFTSLSLSSNVDQSEWKSPEFVTLCLTWPASSRKYRRASTCSCTLWSSLSLSSSARVCCTWNWIKKINQDKTGSSNRAVVLFTLTFLTSLFLPFFSPFYTSVRAASKLCYSHWFNYFAASLACCYSAADVCTVRWSHSSNKS